MQQEVRGRGDNRDPHDLLITDGTAIARMRHGALRGRSNRHGFRCQMGSIHSASHRYFRNQVEAHQMELHLCSSDPCTAGEDDVFHVASRPTGGGRTWTFGKVHGCHEVLGVPVCPVLLRMEVPEGGLYLLWGGMLLP